MASVVDLEYVAYGHRDLGEARKFLGDFGLKLSHDCGDELLFRGCSTTRYCYVARQSDQTGIQAIALRAKSEKDLIEVSSFPESGEIETIDRPGGGMRVRLSSPDGIPFEVVWGIQSVEALPMRDPLVVNHALEKRRTGSWQRPDLEPAAVLRLGHVAILTNDFATNAEWLGARFNLKPSDILFDGTIENSIGGFFHCAGADGWTDHHTLALFPSEKSGIHHASFEVQDFDAQFLGNKHLKAQGWEPLWGIGRHILGSQIFDYWFDPSGNVVEHFTDGDLVKSGREPEYHQVSDDSLAQWGPPMPVVDFIEKRAYDPN